MLVLIILRLAVADNTVTAFAAEVGCPLAAFAADSVCASKTRRYFGTAILTQLTARAGFLAVIANTALTADRGAICADLAAFAAEIRAAIAAITALFAHHIRTVRADAAIGTEEIKAISAFSAILAPIIGTIAADKSAAVADFDTDTARLALLTPAVLSRTFTAQIAGYAEFIGTFRAFFPTFGTEIGTFLASVSAWAGNNAVAAFLTV